jgi:hypothetical protein
MPFFYLSSLVIEEAMELCASFDLWQLVQRDPISFVFEEKPRRFENVAAKSAAN